MLMYSCSTTKKVAPTYKNVAFLYNPALSKIHPDLFIYHSSDTLSLLFFKINVNEMYFNKEKSDKNIVERAKIKVSYRLMSSFGQNAIVDSSSVIYAIDKENLGTVFASFIAIKVADSMKYSLEVNIQDLQQYKRSQTFLQIDKQTKNKRQNFMLLSKEFDEPIYENHLKPEEEFKIISDRNNKKSKLYVDYYSSSFELPPPPFSLADGKMAQVKSDSTWILNYNTNNGVYFSLNYKGIYHFRFDTTQTDGFTLFNRGENFPNMKTPQELIVPLKYLNTNKGYKDLEFIPSNKQAIDDFWLKTTGNLDRAKELIRVYYSRLLFANFYFSSYNEGWKTDRGMIYTLMGAPSIIYKSETAERWMYSENTNLASFSFLFTREKNPFTDNDFVLNRSEIYKDNWYQAVDSWRNGRVFSIGN